MRWPERLTRNVEVVERFANGEGVAEIAFAMRIDAAHVRQILVGADIDHTVNKDSAAARKRAAPSARTVEMLKARALGARMSEIARRYGVSRQRVSAIIAQQDARRSETDPNRSEKR